MQYLFAWRLVCANTVLSWERVSPARSRPEPDCNSGSHPSPVVPASAGRVYQILLNNVHRSGVIIVLKRYQVHQLRVAGGLLLA